MTAEFVTRHGGFKLGDRVHHVGDPSVIGTVIRFDSRWLYENPEADVFDVGVIWDDALSFPDPLHVDWQFSNRLAHVANYLGIEKNEVKKRAERKELILMPK